MAFQLWPFILMITLYIINVLAVDPTIYSEPSVSVPTPVDDITKLVKESVVFQCPELGNIEWEFKKNNETVTVHRNNHTYEIANLSLANDGTYICLSGSRAVKQFRLTIHEPPYFTKKHQMGQKLIVKPAGNMAQLKCKAAGTPMPNITWLKNGQPPNRQLGGIKYNHWTLTLEDLVTNDSGNYTCRICNIVSCINYTYSIDVVERFPHKPYIQPGYPENITVVVNSTAKFECPLMIVDLEPFIYWVHFNSTYAFDENNPKPPDDNEIKVLKPSKQESS